MERECMSVFSSCQSKLSVHRANPQKVMSIQRKIQAQLAGDHELKEEAQRAFQSYLKSVFLMKNKLVFDVTKLDTESFAASLGLAVAPRVRFIQKRLKAEQKEVANKQSKAGVADSEVESPAAKPTFMQALGDSDGKSIVCTCCRQCFVFTTS